VIITARQCSGVTMLGPPGYLGVSGDVGTVPGVGEAVVGAGGAGVCVNVWSPTGPPGPSGSTTVVVGDGEVGDVGLVVSSPGDGDGDVVSVVVVVVAVVVVVLSDSFGLRTFVRGTHV
jgi:hypothetical protein